MVEEGFWFDGRTLLWVVVSIDIFVYLLLQPVQSDVGRIIGTDQIFKQPAHLFDFIPDLLCLDNFWSIKF